VPLNARANTLKHDGFLRLFTSHLQEYLEVRYEDSDGNIIPEAMTKLESFLRSRGDDTTHPIDPELIRLVDHWQDHFKADAVEVISGYRSPAFNHDLKETGHAVANESYHMKGQACDMHLDETNETELRDYAASLKLGGVGYYGNLLFVHVDTGPVRQWDSGHFKNNTEIGIFNKSSVMKWRTDRLVYRIQDSIHVQISSRLLDVNSVKIEKFWRGKWTEAGRINMSQQTQTPEGFSISEMAKKLKVGVIPYGKYRFRVESASDWQNSNEFYIKQGKSVE
jgi:uncharacterized protein YcbK (DUF882 family)